jgi:hypothetical protein
MVVGGSWVQKSVCLHIVGCTLVERCSQRVSLWMGCINERGCGGEEAFCTLIASSVYHVGGLILGKTQLSIQLPKLTGEIACIFK